MKKNNKSFIRGNLCEKYKNIVIGAVVITLLLSTAVPTAGFLVDEQNHLLSQFTNEQYMHSDPSKEGSQEGINKLMNDEASDFFDSSSENSTVCGYVDDAVTSFPIQGAYVSLTWQNQGQWDWNDTTTNESGFYSMNVAAGEIYLYVYKDGYFDEDTEWMEIGEYEILWINFSLTSYPPENAVVCGFVSDDITSLPIENANADLNWRDGQGHYDWNSTMTNASGFYSMNVAAGEIRLNVYAEDYFYNETEWFDVDEYEILWINVSLFPEPPENSVVCGYVTDENTSLPIEGVNVYLDWRDNQGHYRYNYTTTNESGYYSMNVAAGIFNLNFYSEEYFYEWYDDEVIGEYEIVWFNVSLYPRPPQNSVVCGYITDFDTGLPLTDVWVSLSWRDIYNHYDGNSTSTNATGFYSMNVAAGEVQIYVDPEGYFDENSGWFEIGDYETVWVNLSLHLRPPENSTVCGYVYDFDTGFPLEDVDIDLYWRDDEGHDYSNYTNTNSSGFYSLNTAAGQIFIRANLNGYAWNVTDWMTIGEYELLWVNFTWDQDITPPTIYNISVPEDVGIYSPGDISVNVYDDHLNLVYIILYDAGNITFDQSLVIIYLIDFTGESGTFTIEEYDGTYGDLTQDTQSTPTTVVMLNNYTETNNLHTVAFFMKNQSSAWEQIIVEYNYSNGLLKNIARPLSLPDGTIELEYITDTIESGVSIISPLAMLPEGGFVGDLEVNYTLYSIGDPNNPYLNWTLLMEGEYAGIILAQDRADNINQSAFGLLVNHTQPDTEPPETNHELDGTTGENDWYVSCVTITLIATDDLSGVAATYYRIDGGDWMEYTEPFEVCDDGEHTLEYYSVDNAENEEEIKGPFDFKIDQTPPQISLAVEKQAFNKWLFIADVDDATSGVARVEFYVDDEFVGEVTEPPYVLLWTGISFDKGQAIAYDNAGNSAESEEVADLNFVTNNSQIYLVRGVKGEQSL